MRKTSKLAVERFRSFPMKSEGPNNRFIVMRCTQYAPRVLGGLGLSGFTDHRPNSIAIYKWLYVVQPLISILYWIVDLYFCKWYKLKVAAAIFTEEFCD